MTFDEALKEIKRHADAKREQESYLRKIHGGAMEIYNNVTLDELGSWRLVESLISSGSKVSSVDEEHIRDLLKGM